MNFIEKSCHYHADSLKTRSLCSLQRQVLLVLVVLFSAYGDPQVTHILSDMTSVISQLIFLGFFRFSPRNEIEKFICFECDLGSFISGSFMCEGGSICYLQHDVYCCTTILKKYIKTVVCTKINVIIAEHTVVPFSDLRKTYLALFSKLFNLLIQTESDDSCQWLLYDLN